MMQTREWCAWRLAFLIAAVGMWPQVAGAAGALAVARPSDIAAEGYSYGTAFNFDSEEEARTAALNRCRDTKSEKRREMCKVIVIFKGQCVAVAMDPKDGTPGVGWSVAETKDAVDRQALAQCRDTAGPGRRDACKVDKGAGCDTRW
jgi:hypothetical protein